MVQEWEDREDPAIDFHDEDLYDEMKELVHSHRVSGTFYHIFDEREDLDLLEENDFALSRWEKEVPDEGIYLKLTCENHPGLELKREIILGESNIRIKGRVGNEITVTV